MSPISANLAYIQTELIRICQECGRDPNSVKIVAVSKNRTAGAINTALESGLQIIGENRVQEALNKFPQIKLCERHFIGHLQTNKIREVTANFDCVESVDSVRLAEKLSTECQKLNKTLPIFLQVNLAAETTKSGFSVEELKTNLPFVQKLPNLKLVGLMVIGPLTPDQTKIREIFTAGKKLVDEFALPYYSAGMSNDWPLAVCAGTTHIRLGRVLFDN